VSRPVYAAVELTKAGLADLIGGEQNKKLARPNQT
jgi:hypothetical protein